MKKLVFLFFIVFSVGFSEVPFKDITDEHWAYKSVENLLNKGILKQDSEIFQGKNEVTRYEFAYYLSKVINKSDSEKASRDDLEILENLVYEFSKELNKMGFDSDLYLSMVKSHDEKIKELNSKLEENRKLIDELQRKIRELEKNKKTF
ncbi:S-layer homology domain-containing protein [Ilyobacter polytropus]|uniref:S-layer domain protein n=1 Tax=Ilyobacter polytropus (strain ATCC 51220 / DSM 2926 / LMG 16218 / CuHBu1) TaxID=572544 RepID=E3HAD7_ILYPC|nr:S-layer homology domain-containing protein [Ilyobacter polytropus]ADO83667.1 S-layer domain protein [Ilyobacter polytropus DSM 2926]